MHFKKGFTLIELLAVIIILGVLMLIAIPSITKYINDTKKSSYLKTIDSYVAAARLKVISLETDQNPTLGEGLLIPFSDINIEKDNKRSPYGSFDLDRSYIIAVNNGDKYSYYVNAIDTAGYKISNVISNEINKNNVTSSNGIPDPISIDEVISGSMIDIHSGNVEVSSKNNSSSSGVLLSVNYGTYYNGQQVTLLDNSTWYVVNDLGNSLVLLSSKVLDSNGLFVNNGSGYKTMFNVSSNFGKYDVNVINSPAYILENIFKPIFIESINNSGGYSYGIEVSLLSAEDVVRLTNTEQYYDYSVHETVEPGNGVLKGEYLHNLKVLSPLTTTNPDSLNYLLNYSGYWIKTTCEHNDVWQAGAATRIEYNCMAGSSNGDLAEIRPIVTILKANIKTQ